MLTKKTAGNPRESVFEQAAHAATERVGSPLSLVIHSFLFVGIFGLSFFGWALEDILLFLTTLVSLEAIYLAIFIQMTVNRQAREIKAVSEDVEEIAEEMEDIGEDVEEISEDIEGIQKEVKDIGEEVEDIGEDIEEDKAETQTSSITQDQLNKIETTLQKLLEEIEKTKQSR